MAGSELKTENIENTGETGNSGQTRTKRKKSSTNIAAIVAAVTCAVMLTMNTDREPGADPERAAAGVGSALCRLANAEFVNPNAGRGLYTGTPGPRSIAVECSAMNVMNTLAMTYAPEFGVMRHCVEGLVELDAKGGIVPAAAESWESSEDGMRWTFRLRPGLKWVDSEGNAVRDVTARDFVFAWQELINPDRAFEYWSFGSIFKGAAARYAREAGPEAVAIRAADDLTIEFELEEYIPYTLQYLAFGVMSPVPEDFYLAAGADAYGTAPDKMLYNGAFRMTKWVPESVITAERNALWRDAASVELERVDFVKYTNTNTLTNAFRGGEADVIELGGETRAEFAAEGYAPSSYTGGYSFYYLCNTLAGERPGARLSPMRSLALRRAVSAALDRRLIVDTLMKNDNEPAKCFTLASAGVGAETFAGAVVAANGGEPLYNPAADTGEAKRRLEEALVELGLSSPSEIKLSIMTSEGTQSERFSQFVQELLRRELGIEADIDVLTIAECRARRNAMNYDIFMTGWGPDYNDPMTYLCIWRSDDGNNHSGYANPEYDALLDAASRERDPAAREAILIEAERMLARDLPGIPVYWRREDYIMSEKIKSGVVRAPFQHYWLGYVRLADGR